MSKMVVMVREKHQFSPFRKALIDLIKAPGDELILSYGALTNCITVPRTHWVSGKKVLVGISDEFISALQHQNMKNSTIWLVAGNFISGKGDSQEVKFINAYKSLDSELRTNRLLAPQNIKLRPIANVHTISSTNGNPTEWHTKMALKKQNDVTNGQNIRAGEAAAALIGSSNLSPNTTDERLSSIYPVQSNCDLYLWDENIYQTSRFGGAIPNSSNDISAAFGLLSSNAIIVPGTPAVPIQQIFQFLHSKVKPYLT